MSRHEWNLWINLRWQYSSKGFYLFSFQLSFAQPIAMAAPTATPPAAVEHVQSVIGYRFSDSRLLLEALRAAGSGYNMHPSNIAIDGNKRLATLGDAIMKMAVLDEWYASMSERGIAQYNRRRSLLTGLVAVASRHVAIIGSTETLSGYGRGMGLATCISTNPSQVTQPPSSAIISRTLQAIVGAVWLDSGRNFEMVKHVLYYIKLLPMPIA
jgi:ribonuclease III